MPTSVSAFTSMPSSAEVMKSLNRFDIAGDPADQVSGSLFVVFGQRQVMDVLIERAPQVVHHPLADAGGKIFFRVGADRADNGDHRHRQHREVQDRELVLSGDMAYDPGEPGRQGL